MSKLHEILAVEADREAAAAAILMETATTFNKRVSHFQGHLKRYVPFAEDAPDAEEDISEIVDTVPGKLKHAFGIIARAIDTTATKDVTNQSPATRAAVIVDGDQLTDDLPATTLLMLEGKLKGLEALLREIPTLAPGRRWEPDTDKGEGVYRDANPETKFRTRKIVQHKVLTEATPHHPAQIERWNEDERIGKIVETSWSSMMSPADKSEILGRLQILKEAVKQARMRANGAEVVQTRIAHNLFKFLLPTG